MRLSGGERASKARVSNASSEKTSEWGTFPQAGIGQEEGHVRIDLFHVCSPESTMHVSIFNWPNPTSHTRKYNVATPRRSHPRSKTCCCNFPVKFVLDKKQRKGETYTRRKRFARRILHRAAFASFPATKKPVIIETAK